MTVDSMGGIEGRIARFEYYFRPVENAIAGVVAGVTTAKTIKATGKVPYGDMDKVAKGKGNNLPIGENAGNH